MLIALFLAGAAAGSTPATRDQNWDVSDRSYRTTRVNSSCIGSRCALYVNGRRTGSYSYEYGRVVVRSNGGRRVFTGRRR
jgi:hypothetical protein